MDLSRLRKLTILFSHEYSDEIRVGPQHYQHQVTREMSVCLRTQLPELKALYLLDGFVLSPHIFGDPATSPQDVINWPNLEELVIMANKHSCGTNTPLPILEPGDTVLDRVNEIMILMSRAMLRMPRLVNLDVRCPAISQSYGLFPFHPALRYPGAGAEVCEAWVEFQKRIGDELYSYASSRRPETHKPAWEMIGYCAKWSAQRWRDLVFVGFEIHGAPAEVVRNLNQLGDQRNRA